MKSHLSCDGWVTSQNCWTESDKNLQLVNSDILMNLRVGWFMQIEKRISSSRKWTLKFPKFQVPCKIHTSAQIKLWFLVLVVVGGNAAHWRNVLLNDDSRILGIKPRAPERSWTHDIKLPMTIWNIHLTRATGSSSIVSWREGGVELFLENAPIDTLKTIKQKNHKLIYWNNSNNITFQTIHFLPVTTSSCYYNIRFSFLPNQASWFSVVNLRSETDIVCLLISGYTGMSSRKKIRYTAPTPPEMKECQKSCKSRPIYPSWELLLFLHKRNLKLTKVAYSLG